MSEMLPSSHNPNETISSAINSDEDEKLPESSQETVTAEQLQSDLDEATAGKPQALEDMIAISRVIEGLISA